MDRLIIVGARDRWPDEGPMARVASIFQELADEGKSAKFVSVNPEPKGQSNAPRRKQPMKGRSPRN